MVRPPLASRLLTWTAGLLAGALAPAVVFVACTQPQQDVDSVAERATAVAVLTNRYDNGRSGVNATETALTPAAVAGGSFGLLFSRTVDGQIYAQPLYVPGLSIAGGTHNVVYVATEHNSVYAFDADNPTASQPLWRVSLGTSCARTPGRNMSCADMFAEVGITSTPVIDTARGVLYVVTKTVTNGVYAQRLHALSLTTGAEMLGGPVALSATGFDPQIHLNRPGLLLAGGVVHVAFASHCDDGAYHGWVFAHDAATLARRAVYNTTPAGSRGGIWQSGMGLSTDGTGVFFVSGNGSFDGTGNGAQLGISVGKLSLGTSAFSVADFWTPANAQTLNDGDEDLTSGAILPSGSNLLFAGGKDGNVYVLDRTNLGRFHTDGNRIRQTFAVGGHVHGAAAWNGPQGLRFFVWPENSAVRAYSTANGTVTTTPAAISAVRANGHPGGIISVSSSGTSGGIVWGNYATSGDAWHDIAPGALVALDAGDLHLLWSSDINRDRDAVGNFGKFCPPTVTNGRVYLCTFSNALRVYGLGALPTNRPVFVSDLPFTSATNGWGPVERDKSNGEQNAGDGHTITIKGVTYAKGLGVHAASDVRVNLGGLYSTFVSDVGVDDETVGGGGSVIFQVFLDGVKAFDSGIVLGGQAARHVNLPVENVKELRLVVIDDGNGLTLDHADWAGAQLVTASFLSNLPFTSATNGWGPVERDKSNGEQAAGDGHTITIGGVTYAKGLGMHAAADVRLNLARFYKTFASDIGIDDETAGKGSAVFQVWLDGVKAFDSGAVLGGQAARHVNLSVANVQELRLVVTDSGDGIGSDHADWAGAKLTKLPLLGDQPFLVALNGWGPVERDMSNGEQAAGDGRLMAINAVTFPKGIGTHANADVHFNLGGRYSAFSADIGVDDETRGAGSVVFQVWVDGSKLFDSGVVRAGTAARHISVPLAAGTNDLRLVVTDGGDGIGSDHADWGNAQLTAR